MVAAVGNVDASTKGSALIDKHTCGTSNKEVGSPFLKGASSYALTAETFRHYKSSATLDAVATLSFDPK